MTAIFILLVAALAASGVSPIAQPAETAAIPVSGSATFDGGNLGLTFAAVTRDNRCPKDVQCVVAGAAHVRLIAALPGRDDIQLVFEVPPGGGDRTQLKPYDITLERLDPQAHSAHPIEPGEYVVTVRIARLPDVDRRDRVSVLIC